MQEQFIPIPGFENYAVSNYGRIQRLTPGPWTEPGKIKTPQHNKKTGYCHVKVSGSLGKRSMSLHRLVAQAFLPNPNNYREVDHIDRDKTNNHVDNLRWCTREENMANVTHNGGCKKVMALAPYEMEWRIYDSLRGAARAISAEVGIPFLPQGIYNALVYPRYTHYKFWKFKYFGNPDENHT